MWLPPGQAADASPIGPPSPRPRNTCSARTHMNCPMRTLRIRQLTSMSIVVSSSAGLGWEPSITIEYVGNALIQRGGGTGPVKPRQPPSSQCAEAGANSGREVFLEDERCSSQAGCAPSLLRKGSLFAGPEAARPGSGTKEARDGASFRRSLSLHQRTGHRPEKCPRHRPWAAR
jgi:hypothetical protein